MERREKERRRSIKRMWRGQVKEKDRAESERETVNLKEMRRGQVKEEDRAESER
jgi:hypothetical protein